MTVNKKQYTIVSCLLSNRIYLMYITYCKCTAFTYHYIAMTNYLTYNTIGYCNVVIYKPNNMLV